MSTKLPDPPVFSGTNGHVPFDDWKIKIQDKLTYNSDHYPGEGFKVAYIMARLSGEASKHISLKRRQRSDHTCKELLDLLSDLYETPLSVIYKENSHTYHHLKQGNRPFAAFYKDFVRCSEQGPDREMAEDLKVWDLEDRLKERLREPLASCCKEWTISDLKVYLTRLDQSQRMMAENLAQQKAQAFAVQYAKARAEAEAKRRPPGKYSILTRSDSGYGSGEDPAYWR